MAENTSHFCLQTELYFPAILSRVTLNHLRGSLYQNRSDLIISAKRLSSYQPNNLMNAVRQLKDVRCMCKI